MSSCCLGAYWSTVAPWSWHVNPERKTPPGNFLQTPSSLCFQSLNSHLKTQELIVHFFHSKCYDFFRKYLPTGVCVKDLSQLLNLITKRWQPRGFWLLLSITHSDLMVLLGDLGRWAWLWRRAQEAWSLGPHCAVAPVAASWPPCSEVVCLMLSALILSLIPAQKPWCFWKP